LGVEGRSELVEALSRLSLFADLSEAQLQDVAHAADEEVFEEGRRILRENLSGSGLFFILDGEVAVRLAGNELARLGRGEFFGEISVVLPTAPMADVVAASLVRCLVVPSPDVERFLVERPRVLYRMFQAEARRLMAAERRAAGR
jgi:CRP-like cAMP-binding protein